MEQAAQLDPALIPKFFELGLMGIEIPEAHGGAGGSLFMTVLAVEELSAVDASAAIFVDVQNTLVNALLLKWASDDNQAALSARALRRSGRRVRAVGSRVGIGRLWTRDEGDEARRQVDPRRSQAVDHERRRSGILRHLCDGGREQGLQGDHRLRGRARLQGFQRRQERRQARYSRVVDGRADSRSREVPAANLIGEVGNGYKVAIETLNDGPHRHRRADDRRGARGARRLDSNT
jgi:hypothetical protein